MPDEKPTPFDPKAPDRLRIGTANQYLQWVFDNAEQWTAGRQEEHGADLILISIFARSARTYEGIVRCLGEKGFGEQGLMLNRSLFEDMIDAHWLSINRDLATNRLYKHDIYSRLLRAETQRKYPKVFDGRKPPPIKVTNEERKEMQSLFGQSGSGSWTGVRSLDERVDLVKHLWGEAEEALMFWWDWVQKLHNEVLHPSAFSLARLGAPTIHQDENDGESLEWHFGSTVEWLGRSVHAAYWTFSQTVSLIVDEFAPNSREQLNERDRIASQAFRNASHWEKVGRYETPAE